jgi:hypothetical protein
MLAVAQGDLPAGQGELDLLEFCRWNIDRYDRLRSSTSTRASVLLSGSAVVLTGVILLVNLRLQSADDRYADFLDWVFVLMAAMTATLVVGAIASCVSAIASTRTARHLHQDEIPSRFIFNWRDTLRSVDGCSSFIAAAQALTRQAVVRHALAELWTDILQHSRRHRHLRRGIQLFRYCVASATGLTVVTFMIVAGWNP